jgi:transposase
MIVGSRILIGERAIKSGSGNESGERLKNAAEFATGTGVLHDNMKTPSLNNVTGQPEKLRTVCADIAKASFTWASEDRQEGIQPQTNHAVREWLRAQLEETRRLGYTGLQIVCESTAGYHKRLLRIARAEGCTTALVSAEQVKAMQVVESNDTGKSDWKDPRTMLLLVQLGKTLTDRQLHGEWAALRELNVDYEHVERRGTQVKNRIHGILLQLFPDLSFKKDWLFTAAAARAVLAVYGFNPYAIVAAGEAPLRRTLRKQGVREKTSGRIFRDALQSVLQPSDALWREIKTEQLRDAYADLSAAQQRREKIRAQMIALLEALQGKGEVKLQPQKGLIGAFLLARILGETGPLGDFKSVSQLLRYAGMNLRPNQSGEHRGPERQAKRGRARLRAVLAQAVLKLVVRTELYGPYFHAKKAAGMPGAVAMTAVARKFLKLLFGLNHSAHAFDPARVFKCHNEYAKAA